MDHGLIAMPVEASELTRPNTGSSFYSGVTSPSASGSSEDEFYDAPESMGNQGTTESSAEPRISTPLVSTDITPTLQPTDSPPFPVPLDPPPLNQFLPVTKLPKPRAFPGREEDFSSLDSIESASETETITAVNRHIFTSSPLMETEEILTTETAIPGFNGDTTNILTFLSPNPDSASKEFTFEPFSEPSTPDLPPAPNLMLPVPDSELLDETLQNRLLTPDFPPPPSPLSAGSLYPTTQYQMETVIPRNPQKLYPELDMSSPPLWGFHGAHTQLPISPLTPPPPQDPSGLLNMPQMERNPLFVPDQIPSHPQSDFMLLGSIPPSLVINPLTQQIILAQQQALSQQYSNNIPQVQFPHQMHPNNIIPANLMAGFQSYSPHHFNSMSAPFGHFNEGQFDSNETWNENDEDSLADWKRDLMLKEKRILRDKFGDNRMNGWTDRHLNKFDPQETENMSPLNPNSPEHEKHEFHLQTQSQECDPEDTRPDRICYPSLPLNSSDEEISAKNKSNETAKILPGFLSRMKNSIINQQHSVPPTNNPNISSLISTETYHCLTEQPTNQYNTAQNGTRDIPMYPPLPPLPVYVAQISEPARTATKPILYPPTRPICKPQREIKRPPLDTSSSPSPLKPCKREISYPPGLEPSTSPKKQTIYYPPTEHRRIRYPPRNDSRRPPNTSFSSFHFNNESSFLGSTEIIYPHSWTDTTSLKGSPVKEVYYPPRPVDQSDASLEEKIDEIPEIPKQTAEIPEIPKQTAGDITPPIQDSSDNEEVTGTRNCPLESTPIKQPLITNTEDKPDLDSDLGGFETPTEVD